MQINYSSGSSRSDNPENVLYKVTFLNLNYFSLGRQLNKNVLFQYLNIELSCDFGRGKLNFENPINQSVLATAHRSITIKLELALCQTN